MAETLSKRDLYMPSKLIDNFRAHLQKNKEEQKETIVEVIQAQSKKGISAAASAEEIPMR